MILFNDPAAFDALVAGPPRAIEIFVKTFRSVPKPGDIQTLSEELGWPAEKIVVKGKSAYMQKEITTLVLPAGSVIHRHDHAGATAPSEAMPAFFGNIRSTALYSRGNPEALSSYRIKRDVVLMNMNVGNLLTVAQSLDGEDEEVMGQYLQQGEDGRWFVIPTIPVGRPNAAGHIPYLNRRIADIVCAMGFDGWVVKPLNSEKREGLRQFSLVRGGLVPYAPEILLCRWSEVAERIGAGMDEMDGGRLTRHRTRRSNTRRGKSKASKTRKH
jgi:hypothetical protein